MDKLEADEVITQKTHYVTRFLSCETHQTAEIIVSIQIFVHLILFYVAVVVVA